jgi:IS30 family transposase
VDKSTISRELRRNRNKEGDYLADRAIKMTVDRQRRIIPTKFTEKAKGIIEDKLNLSWSPE